MARPSYLLNHNPITNLVCITYGYGKYTIIIIIIIIIIIPGQGEFGLRHPGWGRENR